MLMECVKLMVLILNAKVFVKIVFSINLVITIVKLVLMEIIKTLVDNVFFNAIMDNLFLAMNNAIRLFVLSMAAINVTRLTLMFALYVSLIIF